MSIIQEALKKAQKVPGKFSSTSTANFLTRTEDKEVIAKVVKEELRATSKKNNIKSALYGLAFLVLLSVIAAGYFSSGAHKSNLKDKTLIKPEAKESPFETSPIIAFAQKTPAPVQPAPVPPPSPVIVPTPITIIPVQALSIEDFELSGIMHLEDGPRAIINNITVVEGDKIEGALVTSIDEDSVVLTRKNADITLRLKRN